MLKFGNRTPGDLFLTMANRFKLDEIVRKTGNPRNLVEARMMLGRNAIITTGSPPHRDEDHLPRWSTFWVLRNNGLLVSDSSITDHLPRVGDVFAINIHRPHSVMPPYYVTPSWGQMFIGLLIIESEVAPRKYDVKAALETFGSEPLDSGPVRS